MKAQHLRLWFKDYKNRHGQIREDWRQPAVPMKIFRDLTLRLVSLMPSKLLKLLLVCSSNQHPFTSRCMAVPLLCLMKT
jgi:hypothetical protein